MIIQQGSQLHFQASWNEDDEVKDDNDKSWDKDENDDRKDSNDGLDVYDPNKPTSPVAKSNVVN